jgi:hypothetical protein
MTFLPIFKMFSLFYACDLDECLSDEKTKKNLCFFSSDRRERSGRQLKSTRAITVAVAPADVTAVQAARPPAISTARPGTTLTTA